MLGRFTEAEELLKRTLNHYNQIAERKIRESLVGSTITDIKARYNPGTEDYTIQIFTNAEPVKMPHPMTESEVPFMTFHCNIITFRGKPEGVNVFS